MDIYAARGSKVRFLNKGGSEFDRKNAVLTGLKEGEVYTVEELRVHSFSSYVILAEFPYDDFNTVMFEDVEIIKNPPFQLGEVIADVKTDL